MAVDKLRFGAKTPDGRCSSLWVAVRSGSDVYVGVRSLAGKFKLSLHRDGRAQVSLTSELYARLSDEGLPPPPSRHFARWRMPDVPDKGAVQVASIIFPSRFLRPRPPLKLTKPVFWERAPEQGSLEVGLFYGKRLCSFGRPGEQLRFWSQLSDGRVVMVAVRNTEHDAAHVVDRLSGSHKVYALSHDLWSAPPGEVIADCTAFAWSDVQDGQGVAIWEIARLSLRRN